ncbi:hypothetical protein HGP14_16320 [Rhizobium sp. P32RR-XVIII]|uniref:hypothetical protein n=1 Tax=Rhizobium sp. P32RR-XVIII TaxID=2726738 RepID=UPI0014572352|nr:hypothetical protein [Rhizobium sp. P32RR-XVIII]NLS04910.1 hypothetical protein [Rhizobium sp. P32RR-XVIII]
MDPLSLVAAHMLNRRPPPKMNAAAEDRYYSDDFIITLWRRRLRLLGLMAPAAGVILLVIGIVQV